MNKDRQIHNSISKVFETEWFSIDALQDITLGNKPYYRLTCADSVSIIATTVDEKIILINQYRPPIEHYSLEFPSGYVDDDEKPEEAIKRELEEEAGYVCDSVSYMGLLRICPSRINNWLHVFFGKNAIFTEINAPDAKKEFELVLVTKEEFLKLILEGKYIEVAGISMFYLAQTNGYI